MNIDLNDIRRMEQLRVAHLLRAQGLPGAIAFCEQMAKTYAQEACSYSDRFNKDMEAVMAAACLVISDEAGVLRRQGVSLVEPSTA